MKIDCGFLKKPVSQCETDIRYINAKEAIIFNIAVVNVAAAKDVKLVNDFVRGSQTKDPSKYTTSSG